MLSSLKIAKKYMHVYYFDGKHFTCWDCVACLKLTTLGRKIVNSQFTNKGHAQVLGKGGTNKSYF